MLCLDTNFGKKRNSARKYSIKVGSFEYYENRMKFNGMINGISALSSVAQKTTICHRRGTSKGEVMTGPQEARHKTCAGY